ncbi:MAG: hypothetical protein OEY77_03270 [Nitrospira sp.]|nr:hypothetical protein [Nitrospira sp.]
MMGHIKRQWKTVLVAGAVTALVAGMGSPLPSAYAGGTIKADDDKWISIGMGIRTSFNAIEGAAGGHYSNDFKVDNARIYIDGQIHKYVKFTFNTECFNCNVGGGGTHFGGNSNIGLLDAIGKFEINELVNLWVGRTLVPSERGELNGPFYHATFDGFRTPFFPADFSGNFPGGPGGATGGQAGLYGRDNGAVFFGKIHPFGTHLMYVASVFTGNRGGPNPTGSLLYAGRLQWNLLNDEVNPGYYTSGTYYGTAGDILAISGNVTHQKDGAGNPTVAGATSDFTGLSADLLMEKVLPNDMGVVTFNGEFKRFFANYGTQAFQPGAGAFGTCFCIFNGHSWSVYVLYLFPKEIGIGRFQPYVRFTEISPRYANERNEWETGVNYIIAGHNARVSAYYRYGDLNGSPGGFSFIAPGQPVQKVDSFHVALQLQY